MVAGREKDLPHPTPPSLIFVLILPRHVVAEKDKVAEKDSRVSVKRDRYEDHKKKKLQRKIVEEDREEKGRNRERWKGGMIMNEVVESETQRL